MDPKKLRTALLTIKLDMVYRGVTREAAEARFVEVARPAPAAAPQ
jgi:hypothetical protein